METTPAARIRMFRESKGYKTATAFAEAVGIKVGTLSSIETGRTMPGFEILSSIAEAFPDFDMQWLLTGAGSMLREGRNLTPLPKDPAPQQPTAGTMQVVAETPMEKQLKRENKELREQLQFMRDLMRSGGDLTKLARTGTDDGPESFNSGSLHAATPASAIDMRVTVRNGLDVVEEQDKAA